MLDPDQRDVYGLYLQKRDGEHDTYPNTELYGEFITRHGYRNEADIRFGVFVVMNTIWGNLNDEAWQESGLFKHAERLLTPQRFAEILVDELKGFMPVEQQWDVQTDDYYLGALLKALDSGTRFQFATAKAIRAMSAAS